MRLQRFSFAYVEKLPQEFYGDLAHYAYWDHGNITDHIIDRCTAEQVAAFPGRLLYNAVLRDDSTTPWKLVQKGINGDECIVDILDYCAANRKEGQVWRLLQDGLKISAGNFPALCACIRCEFTDCTKLLLEKGMDFDSFKQWATAKKLDLSQNDTYTQLEAHWAGMQALEEQQGGGMQMS